MIITDKDINDDFKTLEEENEKKLTILKEKYQKLQEKMKKETKQNIQSWYDYHREVMDKRIFNSDNEN
jgi:hypothetical protein